MGVYARLRMEFLHLDDVLELTEGKPSRLVNLGLREVSSVRSCLAVGALTDAVEGGGSPLTSRRSWRNMRGRQMTTRTELALQTLSRS